MDWFLSSTGRKYLMALSGLALLVFITGHLAGNLRVFQGADALNSYAAFLQSQKELLWTARIGLLLMAGLHVWTAISLTLDDWSARPVAYAKKDYIKASLASRTMWISGLFVLFFFLYHLLHFTFHRVHPEFGHFIDAQGRRDVYRSVVMSFHVPVISSLYLAANFLLGMHLSHGVYSAFQSLGFMTEALRSKIQRVAQMVGYGIFAGYAAIPLSILFGWVKP
jgi:succinate dehydrogenase / fumarate reductase, cytochrome b subunit